MADKYWDTEEVVGEVKKDNFAKYIISACTKNGKKFVNVREWYCTQADPNYKPAKSGMAIPVTKDEHWTELIAAMNEAHDRLERV